MTSVAPPKPPKPSYSIDTAGPSDPESLNHVDIRVSPPSSKTPRMVTPQEIMASRLPPPGPVPLNYSLTTEPHPHTFDTIDDDSSEFTNTSPEDEGRLTIAPPLNLQDGGSVSPTSTRFRSSHSPKRRHGATAAKPDGAGRRNSKSEGETKRVSPLSKRLGEEVPFMLPHPSKSEATNTAYPGVIIGSFAGQSASAMGLDFGVDDMRFDGTMDDIMDASVSAASGTLPSTAAPGGAAQPNIAPWLMDDEGAPPKSPSPVKNGDSSKQGLSHFASVPTLPKLPGSQANGSRSGSHPDIYANGDPANVRHRNGSGESMSTLGPKGKRVSPVGDPQQLPGTRHPSIAASRIGRLGSTTSNTSGSMKEKKGFLGGLLKRKTGGSIASRE